MAKSPPNRSGTGAKSKSVDLSRDLDHDGDVDLADDRTNDLNRDGRIDGADSESLDRDSDNDIDAADRLQEDGPAQEQEQAQKESVGAKLGWSKSSGGSWNRPDSHSQSQSLNAPKQGVK